MHRLSGLSFLLLLVCSSTPASPQAASPPSAAAPAPQNGTASAAEAPSPEYAQEPFLIEKYHSTARESENSMCASMFKAMRECKRLANWCSAMAKSTRKWMFVP